MMAQIQDEGLYSKAHKEILERLPYQKERSFTQEEICGWLSVNKSADHRPYRDAIIKVLYNITIYNKKPLLKMRGNRYSLIETSFEELTVSSQDLGQPPKEYGLILPSGDDESTFGLEDSALLQPGAMVVIAGEQNQGKTAMGLNIAADNCSNHPVVYLSSEFNKWTLLQRLQEINWVNIWDNGSLKFKVLKMKNVFEFEDAVRHHSDSLCICDWLKLDEDPYKMRGLLQGLKDNVGDGFVVAIIQKRTYKEIGEGGEGTLDFADLYVSLTGFKSYKRSMNGRGILRVERIKSPKGGDITGRQYAYWLIHGGTRFHNIREVETCLGCKGKCYTSFGNGYKRCERCKGLGVVDIDEGIIEEG